MRLPRVRFKIGQLMIMVAVAAVVLTTGRWAHKAIDGYLKPKGVYYHGTYRAPNGRIIRGNIIYVRSDGVILGD